MTATLYEVTWKPLGYTGVIGELEARFLDDLPKHQEDGSLLVDKDGLDDLVATWEQLGREVPQELVGFFRKLLEQKGNDILSVALG